MIQPIITAQTSAPIATMQHNTEAQSVLQTHHAEQQVQKKEQQIRETVVQKNEGVLYEQNHDAKEEGRNKYVNIYSKKKKKSDKADASNKPEYNRVNFDITV